MKPLSKTLELEGTASSEVAGMITHGIGCSAVVVVAGSVLILAGALKLPSAVNDLLVSPQNGIGILQATIELVFGVWLVGNAATNTAAHATMFAFAGLSLLSAYFFLSRTECECFGMLGIKSSVVLVFDIAVVIALLVLQGKMPTIPSVAARLKPLLFGALLAMVLTSIVLIGFCTGNGSLVGGATLCVGPCTRVQSSDEDLAFELCRVVLFNPTRKPIRCLGIDQACAVRVNEFTPVSLAGGESVLVELYVRRSVLNSGVIRFVVSVDSGGFLRREFLSSSSIERTKPFWRS